MLEGNMNNNEQSTENPTRTALSKLQPSKVKTTRISKDTAGIFQQSSKNLEHKSNGVNIGKFTVYQEVRRNKMLFWVYAISFLHFTLFVVRTKMLGGPNSKLRVKSCPKERSRREKTLWKLVNGVVRSRNKMPRLDPLCRLLCPSKVSIFLVEV